jgi:CHAD domain-containing protein
MVSTHEEIEVKYDLAPDAELPSLSSLLGEVADVSERGLREGDLGEHHLEATYFDTGDLRLTAARTTLRRRTGGTDAGWHLKTPGDAGARIEQGVPLGRAVRTVPVALRRLVADLTDEQPLVPVAQVNTRRRVTTLLDGSGRRLLELADDVVEARRLMPTEGPGDAAGAVQRWREVELELVDGDRDLFDAVDAGLRAAGLEVSESSSKLGRVLSGSSTVRSGPRPPIARPLGRAELTTRSRAGDVVVLHLVEQVQQILDQDPRVRADEADAIHRMRVATRRLRSALRTFQTLFAPPTKPLRDELRWLAAELGTARDAEVLRDRLVRSVASLDAVPGDVPALVAEQLGTAYREAHDRVLGELDSERYQSLLDALQLFVEQPEFTPRAARPSGKVLPRRVAKTYTALADLVEKAHALPSGHERDELLHEARKAAKQVRYAAEAVAVVFGKDARRFAAAVTELQEVLGEHQDSVVTRTRLRGLAAAARPEAAFAYGRLYAREEDHATAGEAGVEEAWAALRAKRLHRWLR